MSNTLVHRVWPRVKATFQEWWNDNTFRLAASLAFYTIFSIAPVLLIADWRREVVLLARNCRRADGERVAIVSRRGGGACHSSGNPGLERRRSRDLGHCDRRSYAFPRRHGGVCRIAVGAERDLGCESGAASRCDFELPA